MIPWQSSQRDITIATIHQLSHSEEEREKWLPWKHNLLCHLAKVKVAEIKYCMAFFFLSQKMWHFYFWTVTFMTMVQTSLRQLICFYFKVLRMLACLLIWHLKCYLHPNQGPHRWETKKWHFVPSQAVCALKSAHRKKNSHFRKQKKSISKASHLEKLKL